MTKAVIRQLESVADAARFAVRVVVEGVRPPYELREVVRQLFELGVRSIP